MMDECIHVQRLCQRIAELEHLWFNDEFRARKQAAAKLIGAGPYYWYWTHLGPLYRTLPIVAGLGDPYDGPLR